MLFDRLHLSPYMADDMGSMTSGLGSLHPDHRPVRRQLQDVVPVLEEVMQSSHPLLIVADDVRRILNSLSRTAEGHARQRSRPCEERRKAELEDISPSPVDAG